MKYILSIDQGTTSSRAILFDDNGQAVQVAQREVKCFFPRSGWVETDALSIWVSVMDVINEVLIKSNLTIDDIDSIGITNQRETTVVWSKETGLPVYNAIVWQSRQSAEICEALNDKKDLIHQKTGLLINPYFSASKVRFILDHVENGQERAEKGELLFGTIDSWIIYKMTMGKVHATDVTNASRTLLFNIKEMRWDEELCKLFNIPMQMLPKVRPSALYRVANYCIAEIPPRAEFMRAQTPQAFRLSLIRKAYKIALQDPNGVYATDDCGIVKRYLPEVPIYIVPGEENNKKLTYKEDFD